MARDLNLFPAMTEEELIEKYSIATARIGMYASELYESVFTSDGNSVVKNRDELEGLILSTRKQMNLEFDLMRAALINYIEDNE